MGAMNPDRTVKRLVAVHPAYDDEKLELMKALKLEGLPPVRVVDCRDYYMAVEVPTDLRPQLTSELRRI
jgi:hypothetical protein